MRLLIATPFYQKTAFVTYLKSIISSSSALTLLGVDWQFYDICGDTYVDRAKNSICAYFMAHEKKFTDLFIIDSDMGWDLEGFMSVLLAEEEFVCGIYPMKGDEKIYPYRLAVNHDRSIITDKIRAEWVPGGFVRLRRSVLEKMYSVYADAWYVDTTAAYKGKTINLFEFPVIDRMRYGDDVIFCRKWRALGGEIYIVPTVRFSHTGAQSWYGCMYDDEILKGKVFDIVVEKQGNCHDNT